MNIRTKQRGFTLPEVVIVIFLFAILLLALMNIFEWQQKVYNFEQADILATGSARVAMNNMTMMIAQGINVVETRNVGGVDYTTGASTVIVKIPSYDSSGNILANTYDYVIYHLSSGKLNQIIDASATSKRKSATKLLSDKVDSFSLSYNNTDKTLASKVTVNLITRAFYRGGHSVSATVGETIFLRNK